MDVHAHPLPAPAQRERAVRADLGAAISVRDLRKTYGDRAAVRGISFDVAPGEVFGLLGANGAGKTTTVEILEGYRDRTSGDIQVLGVDPRRPTRAWRERIGLVLQECELDHSLTVRETVTLFATFYPSPRPIEETLALAGLASKRDALVGSLSGGERRRVDVALGIVGDPDLLFLDEPTTGFDPSARRAAWSMIDDLRALGTTILLTTHYMDEAQQLADRVAIMRDGELIAAGTIEEIRRTLGSRVIVRFRLPDGVRARTVADAVREPVEATGAEATIRTADAQRVLYRLTSWAERDGRRLAGLEVVQPRLDDMFLELMTGEGTDG